VASSIDSIRWYLGHGDGTFNEASKLPFNLPSGVVCGDFDGDQRNDFVVFNKYRTGIEIYGGRLAAHEGSNDS